MSAEFAGAQIDFEHAEPNYFGCVAHPSHGSHPRAQECSTSLRALTNVTSGPNSNGYSDSGCAMYATHMVWGLH